MGVFNRVWVKCPECGELNEFQSKDGNMNDYSQDDVPRDIAEDIVNDDGYCPECEAHYTLEILQKTTYVIRAFKS